MKRLHVFPRRVRRVLHNLGWCRCPVHRVSPEVAIQEMRLRAIEEAIERAKRP